MKSPLWLVAIAFTAVWILGWLVACNIDGDTYRMDLKNDTPEILEIGLCGSDCDKTNASNLVEPGDTYTSMNIVGVLNWYRVQDEEATVLGCIKVYEPDERPNIRERNVSTNLVPCP